MKQLLFLIIILSAFNCSSVNQWYYSYRTEKKSDSGYYLVGTNTEIKTIDFNRLDSLLKSAKEIKIVLRNNDVIYGNEVSVKQDSIAYSTANDIRALHLGSIDHILIGGKNRVQFGVTIEE